MPIDGYAGHPELAQRRKQKCGVRPLVLWVAEGGESRDGLPLRGNVLGGEGAQSPPGPDLQHDETIIFQQSCQAVSEEDGITEVADPVVGVCGIFIGDPSAGNVGDIPALGGLRICLSDRGGKLFQHRVHHR